MQANTGKTDAGDLAALIQHRLKEQLGVHVVVAATADTVFLDGRVRTQQQREQAAQLAAQLAPGKRIENDLEAEQLVPVSKIAARKEAPEVIDEPNLDDLLEEEGLSGEDENDGEEESQETGNRDAAAAESGNGTDELDDPALLHEDYGVDASFTDQPLETNDIDVVDDSVYDADDLAEPDPTYFAPTDPVIRADDKGSVNVLNGFEPTSLDDDSVDLSVEDARLGDEALADAVRRELREDASTTDLQVDVRVVNGVAHLRGIVPSLEDAEDAEAVASEVPGVVNVVDDLDVQGL